MRGWGKIIVCLVVMCAGFQASSQDPCDFTIPPPLLSSNQFRFSFPGESGRLYSIETSTNLQNWVPVATGLIGSFSRDIELSTSAPTAFYRLVRGPGSPFIGALVARQTVDGKGNIFETDSYDSFDPAHSTNGFYDATTRKAGGNLCVSSLLAQASPIIHGRLIIAPTGTYSLGPNGSVGDLGWVGPGVQPGWYQNDFRLCWPELNPPYSSGFPPPTGAGTNTYVLGSFNYFINGDLQLHSSQTMAVQGNATLRVTGSLNMQGTASIFLSPGASQKLFVGTSAGPATAAVLTQVNGTGNASTFQLYGLASTTAVAWTGNANYLGLIYSPEAEVTLGGGGSILYDYQGGIAAKSISLNGHFAVHFDEYLRNWFVQ